jgi:hypothetical protein
MNEALMIGLAILSIPRLDAFVTRLAANFGLQDVTFWAIQFVSTIPERIFLFLLCSLAIAVMLVLTRLVRSQSVRFFIPVAGVFLLFLLLYHLPGSSPYGPHGELLRGARGALYPQNFGAGVALSLALVMAIIQLRSGRRSSDSAPNVSKLGISQLLISLILIPFLGVALLSGWSLQGLARKFHRDPSVQQFSAVNSNGLALDTDNNLLYVSGHGTDRLLAYDVRDLNRGPHRSAVETDWAQSFYYNPTNQELYVFNHRDRTLFLLAAKTLDYKKSVTGLQVFGGDARIAYDAHTDSIIIASEGYYVIASNGEGYPVAVVERNPPQLLYTMRDCVPASRRDAPPSLTPGDGQCSPGYIKIHPTKLEWTPILRQPVNP